MVVSVPLACIRAFRQYAAFDFSGLGFGENPGCDFGRKPLLLPEPLLSAWIS